MSHPEISEWLISFLRICNLLTAYGEKKAYTLTAHTHPDSKGEFLPNFHTI